MIAVYTGRAWPDEKYFGLSKALMASRSHSARWTGTATVRKVNVDLRYTFTGLVNEASGKKVSVR